MQAGLRWGWCTEALDALFEVEQAAARNVVESSRAAIVEGLALRQPNMVEHLDDFVRALDAIDPNLIVELLDALDPEQATQHWTERLAGSDEEASSVDLLVGRALQASGEIRVVAQALRDAPP